MKRILIIEDDDELRQEISELLSFEGFDVVCANDGSNGVRKAFVINPDLILCDVMMPDMNGYEVFQQLFDLNSRDITPFIFVTALGDRQSLRKGMELGADDYLTKPFTREELLRTISVRLQYVNRTENIIKLRVEAIEKNLHDRLQGFGDRSEFISSVAPDELLPDPYGIDCQEDSNLMTEMMKVIETNNVVKDIRTNIYKELRSNCSSEQKELLMQLEKRIGSPNFLWDNLTLFLLEFSKRFPAVLPKIMERHSNLTRYEQTFLAATFLKLETNQIAGLLSVSEGSVRKSRYRLKKKLGLTVQDDFPKYIRSFGF